MFSLLDVILVPFEVDLASNSWKKYELAFLDQL